MQWTADDVNPTHLSERLKCVYYIGEWKEPDSNNLSPKSAETDHDALQSGAYWCACKRGI